MSDPAQTAVDLAFGDDPSTPLLPGETFHDHLRVRRAEGALVDATMLGMPAKLITRYAELEAAFRDDEGFPAGPTYATTIEPCQGVTFESTDGDEHNTLRALSTRELRARPIARFAEHAIEPIADEIIDGFIADGGGDLVELFTARFPFYVFGRRMGLPDDRRDDYFRWSFDILGYPGNPEVGLAAAADLTAYLEPVLAERRGCPADDMLSSMVTAEKDGRRLDDEEVLSHVRAIFAAGASTTHHGLGNTLYALLTHPEALERLQSDPSLIAAAVDEMLRWEPPLGVLPRIAPFDTVVAGQPVSEGEFVLMGIASANRDERVHAEPDVFDIDRKPTRVLTFGFGSHHCPGTHLAKAQIAIGIERLLARLPGLRGTDATASRPSGAILRGPRAIPVEW
ncbi:MAG: cytochrome P450 [Actinomycetota bacterium]